MAAAGNVQSVAQRKSNPGMVETPVPTMAEQTQSFQATLDEREYPIRDMASTEAPPAEGDTASADQQAVDAYLVEQFMSEQMGGEESAEGDMAGQLQQEQIQPISENFIGANLNIKEQLEVLPARIRASFGKTPKEKKSALESFLGKDNVRPIAGSDNFMVKLPGKDKFRKLDPETFDIIGDMFADNYRDSVAQMMGIGGATLAIGAQGPAIVEPVSTVVAGAAGYAAGAAMGDTVADAIAENVLGIPRDPSRGGVAMPADGSKPGMIQSVEAGVERTLDNVTYGLTSSAFNEGLKKVSTVVGDRLKKRAELRAAIRQAKEIPEHAKLKETVVNNMNTIKELQAVDALKPLPGTDIPVLAHQMLPDNKDARLMAQGLQNSREFQTLQTEASKQVGDLVLDMVDTAADLGKGKMKQTIVQGSSPVRPGLQKEVNNIIAGVFEQEGKLIETFRSMAGAKAGSTPVKAPKTMEFLSTIVQDLKIRPNPNGKGFLFMVDDAGKESFDDLAAALGTDSKAFINSFKHDVSKILGKLGSRQGTGGQPTIGSADPNDIAGINLDDLISLSRLVGQKNPAASRIGGLYRKYIGQFSSALRQDAGDATQELLDPENAKRFAESMVKYRTFKEASSDLSSMLNTEMGANTFVRGLLNSGKSGLNNLRAVKAILQDADPKVWNNIKSQFFEEAALKARKLDAKGGLEYDVKKFKHEIMKYGDEFLHEMFPTQNGVNNVAMLRRTLDLGEQMQRTLVNGTDDEVIKITKEVARGMSQFVSAKINSAMAAFGFFTQDKRLMKLMSQRGVDEFLEKVPKGMRAQMGEVLQGVVDYGRGQGMIKMLSSMEGPAGRGYATGVLAPEVAEMIRPTRGAPRSEIQR